MNEGSTDTSTEKDEKISGLQNTKMDNHWNPPERFSGPFSLIPFMPKIFHTFPFDTAHVQVSNQLVFQKFKKRTQSSLPKVRPDIL